MSALEQGVVAAWYRGAPWLWLLRPLEVVFRLIAAGRRALYRSGLLASYRPPRPVVVVGNITVGGTGKTPVVIALVEALQARGLRPGVVSRGYGARAGSLPHRVGPASSAGQCGDEPLLIYRRTGAPCVVSPNRAAAVRELLANGDVDIVLSDDGLQHYGLQRDMEIVVVDARRGLGNGFCLPAGPLREPLWRLDDVDFILQRGGSDPATAVVYRSDGLVNLVTEERRPLQAADGFDRVYAVAGIGQPQQFVASLEDAGFAVEARVFPDHHRYTPADFENLGDRPIIMTEKDAVKCREIVGEGAWYLRISAQLPESLPNSAAALARH